MIETDRSEADAPLPDPASLLPHRPPFLFVTELVSLTPGQEVQGFWQLTGDEWFFSGHFPGRPTLPGVLMIEALAQVGACAVLADPRFAGKIPLLAGADKAKFRRQVVPGDRLDLQVTMARLGSRAGRGVARASVGGETAAEAEILFVVADA
ncbi:MAG: 3-hydroxyacyl-ACP dehydratase FabZ [Acidimicrobiia bacterium]|nr:3-hydroxyacyl-ACP dehydratase FabZ [Acidimicrobiia bacterium]MDH4365266.1 3-hydroxyacyl-ACP dehydratase FabZ [Acidimicrobiia bacterium]